MNSKKGNPSSWSPESHSKCEGSFGVCLPWQKNLSCGPIVGKAVVPIPASTARRAPLGHRPSAGSPRSPETCNAETTLASEPCIF